MSVDESVEMPERDLSDDKVESLQRILNSDDAFVTDGMKDEARRVLDQAGELEDD